MQAKDCHAIISIVTWNHEEYIEDLIRSFDEQTFQNFHIIFIDNCSKDNTLELIPQRENITIIRNSNNQGFSRAHNKGIEMAYKFWRGLDLSDRYIFIINPDIVLEKNCLRELLLSMSCKTQTALIGPKLLRIYEDEIDNMSQKTRSNTIDSFGLEISKSRKIVDRYSGEEIDGLDKIKEVFGVSGAFMCFRANNLEKVKWENEYFDEDFFAYKEDIDLCWRFKNMGFSAFINPNAIAYHHRRVKASTKKNLRERLKNQKNKSSFVQFLSIRNQLWTILKNDFTFNIFIDLPFILTREVGRFFYTLFLNPKNLKAYIYAIKGMPKILRKRKYMRDAITRQEIRKWIK